MNKKNSIPCKLQQTAHTLWALGYKLLEQSLLASRTRQLIDKWEGEAAYNLVKHCDITKFQVLYMYIIYIYIYYSQKHQNLVIRLVQIGVFG